MQTGMAAKICKYLNPPHWNLTAELRDWLSHFSQCTLSSIGAVSGVPALLLTPSGSYLLHWPDAETVSDSSPLRVSLFPVLLTAIGTIAALEAHAANEPIDRHHHH